MDLFFIDLKSLSPILATTIAACIASYTAFRISNKWYDQKGSEVLALEASKAFKLLSAVELTSGTCYKYMNETDEKSKKFIKKILNEYDEQFEQIHNSLELITFVVDDKNLDKCFKDFCNTNYNFSNVIRYKIYGESDVENIKDLEKKIDVIWLTKIHYINELKVILSEYALYKRAPKSSHK